MKLTCPLQKEAAPIRAGLPPLPQFMREQCPECSEIFKAPATLGVHRFHAHGISGRRTRSGGNRDNSRDALEGEIFGELTVIAANRYLGKRKDSASLVRCSCGREKTIRNCSLRGMKARTCGICVKLRDDANWRRVLNYYKTGASSRTRNYSFELSLEQVKRICQLPCGYCGKEPSNTIRRKPGKPVVALYSGIDRVNSEGHYRAGNVIPCCAFCNRAKRKLPLEMFLEQLRRYGSTLQVQDVESMARIIGSKDE
jgi:hypothetical protein